MKTVRSIEFKQTQQWLPHSFLESPFFNQTHLSLFHLINLLNFPQVPFYSYTLFWIMFIFFHEFWCKVWIFIADLRFEAKRAKGVVLKASSGALNVNSKQGVSVEKSKSNDPIVVIDNYDSFTYNLCQVCFLLFL